MKWRTKESLCCSKFTIDAISSLLNHTLAAPLRVTGMICKLPRLGFVRDLILSLLGSKTLGLNVLKIHFVMLANHDQNF